MSHKGGALVGRIAAKLLMTAAFVDLLLILLVFKIVNHNVIDLFPTQYRASGDLRNVEPVIVFALVFAAYWAVFETILGGRTLGRTILGLHMCDEAGETMSGGSRASRGARKLTTLGLAGLQVNDLPGYDKRTGCTWYSRMAPRPMGEWRLVMTMPNGSRGSKKLSQLRGFQHAKKLKFGRDEDWADVALPKRSKASAKHCIVSFQGGDIRIMDMGSSNGTFIGGKRIKPNVPVSLSRDTDFSAADVHFDLQR